MSEGRGSGRRQQPGRYEIRVTGHLDGRWAARFEGLSLRREVDGETVIHGVVADQAALHGLLQRVRDIGLPLVSVTRIEDPSSDSDPRPRSTNQPHDPHPERNDET
jgi:hypothetical protein